jgi:uncharacterized membrane protein
LVQEALGGFLLAAAIGLVIFPFGLSIQRPSQGPQSSFVQAKALARWSRRLSLALIPAFAITIAGYLILYTIAAGEGCTAQFSRGWQYVTLIWAAWVLSNIVLMITAAFLRRRLISHDKRVPQ